MRPTDEEGTARALEATPSAEDLDGLKRTLRASAEGGDVESQYLLGALYAEISNMDTEGLAALAGAWAARMKGTERAVGPWWAMLLEAAEKDERQARHWIERAATGKWAFPPALRTLAAMYRDGTGGPQDLQRMFALMRSSAEAGDLRAQVNLGVFYSRGEGVEKDAAKAAEWYGKVACLTEGDVAARSRALVKLAVLHEEGAGVPKDETAAVEHYRRAAELGDASAQGRYAMALARGEGVEQDLAAAAHWYRRSAEQGNATSQNNLGGMYFAGEGVEADPEEGLRLMERAAAQGLPEAFYNLAMRYGTGEDAPKDRAKAAFCMEQAARAGHAPARCDFGLMLWYGQEVAQNVEEGARWLYLACEQGNEKARAAVLGFIAQLHPDDPPRKDMDSDDALVEVSRRLYPPTNIDEDLRPLDVLMRHAVKAKKAQVAASKKRFAEKLEHHGEVAVHASGCDEYGQQLYSVGVAFEEEGEPRAQARRDSREKPLTKRKPP